MNHNDLAIIGDDEYKKMLLYLKEKVKSSQLKAAVKVNYELLNLYWEFGKEIVVKQKKYAWGDSFLKLLSKDLKREFPNMKGFSTTNLKYIRRFYLFYEKSQQPVDQLQIIFSIPWGHHILIMTKCQNVEESLFYVGKTIENGWSRVILEHTIEGELYKRQGNAITNFDNKLPAVQSELAKQTLKDPYNFDFLTIRDKHDEKDLEEG